MKEKLIQKILEKLNLASIENAKELAEQLLVMKKGGLILFAKVLGIEEEKEEEVKTEILTGENTSN